MLVKGFEGQAALYNHIDIRINMNLLNHATHFVYATACAS